MIVTIFAILVMCCSLCYAYMVHMATITEITLLLLPILPINIHLRLSCDKYIRAYCAYMLIVVLVKLYGIPLWVGSIMPLAKPTTLQQGGVLIANAIVCVGAAALWALVAMAITAIESAKVIDACKFKEDIPKISKVLSHFDFFVLVTMVIECMAITVWYFNMMSIMSSDWKVSVLILIATMLLVYFLISAIIKREVKKKHETLPTMNSGGEV